MRNMSFAMTTEQIKNRTKTVTRRFGWEFLKVGDQVQAVKKAMGLKKGEKVIKLGPLEVVKISQEPLNTIEQHDVIAEGFPNWTPVEFVEMLQKHYQVEPDAVCTRIEFKYLPRNFEAIYNLEKEEIDKQIRYRRIRNCNPDAARMIDETEYFLDKFSDHLTDLHNGDKEEIEFELGQLLINEK